MCPRLVYMYSHNQQSSTIVIIHKRMKSVRCGWGSWTKALNFLIKSASPDCRKGERRGARAFNLNNTEYTCRYNTTHMLLLPVMANWQESGGWVSEWVGMRMWWIRDGPLGKGMKVYFNGMDGIPLVSINRMVRVPMMIDRINRGGGADRRRWEVMEKVRHANEPALWKHRAIKYTLIGTIRSLKARSLIIPAFSSCSRRP